MDAKTKLELIKKIVLLPDSLPDDDEDAARLLAQLEAIVEQLALRFGRD